jgi:hypothetical protein
MAAEGRVTAQDPDSGYRRPDRTRELAEWLVALDDPANIEQRRRVSLIEVIARAKTALAPQSFAEMLAQEADEAEGRAEAEERGDVKPMPAQRPRQGQPDG